MLTPGKIRELNHSNWVCDNDCPDPRDRLDAAYFPGRGLAAHLANPPFIKGENLMEPLQNHPPFSKGDRGGLLKLPRGLPSSDLME